MLCIAVSGAAAHINGALLPEFLPTAEAVVRIELRSEEVAMLREILQSYLGDLRMEVAGTDQMEFREQLKTREVFIKDLLGRLDAPSR
jgi:hypothetical protein